MIGTMLALAPVAMAQSGSVTYNEKVQLEIRLEGDAAKMQQMLPKERTFTRVLHFTPGASLYLSVPKEETEEVNDEMNGGGRMVMKMQEPDEKLHHDLVSGMVTEQREFMSRIFLIESPGDTLPWKLTGNRRDILGYPCLEATMLKDGLTTVAWFTPSIPVSTGPSKFGGLPGLILEVIVNQGKRVITAASIKLADVAELIAKPTKGKKVTREEFNKIVDEKTGERGGGGNRVVIRINQ